MPDDLQSTRIPDFPWTIEAEMVSTLRDISYCDALDLVVIKYLQHGDVHALKWALLEGLPLPHALKYVAHMLDMDLSLSKSTFPYGLNVKSRTPKRGRPSKGPKANMRDWLIFKSVAALIQKNGPGYYDGAIKEIAELDGLEVPTVKRAYDNLKAIQDNYAN